MTQRACHAGRRLVFLAIAAMMGSPGEANAKDAWRPFAAVVCTSEASGPWTLRASGTLIRTKSESGLAYKFRGAEHALDWSFTTSREGHTAARGPGFLMDRFLPKQPASEPGARRQSLEATGEIREYAAPHALVLRIGSTCPRGNG